MLGMTWRRVREVLISRVARSSDMVVLVNASPARVCADWGGVGGGGGCHCEAPRSGRDACCT